VGVNYFSNHNIPYYYAILKLTGKNIAEFNESGNWVKVSPDITKGWIYVICTNNIIYNENLLYTGEECLDQFNKISKIKRQKFIEKRKIMNDTVYKINAEES